MEEVLSKNKCTGCSACANVCPKNAISMEYYEGFLYPVIDQTKCINCGLCKKTCPVLNTQKREALNQSYAAFSKNENTLMHSSSGGIFTEIASYILNNLGVVIGAYLENMKLHHIAIDKKEDLCKLQGSKYLQSEIGDIFRYVRENLNNRKILFVGTPCQIAGLKHFLKKEYDNLFTIDVVCHGVPSKLIFDKYIKYLENKENDKVVNYNFRDKSSGWLSYSNKIAFKNKQIIEKHNQNKYMKLFLSDVALRQSCYECNFKLGNKYSDITLGDFWGIQNISNIKMNEKGTSAVIINTEKGLQLFGSIRENIEFSSCKIESIIKGNPSLVSSSSIDKNKREQFFAEIDKLEFDKLVKKYALRASIYKRVLRKIRKLLANFRQ